MLISFSIMLISFCIYKLSIFFTNKISNELDSYAQSEYINCGFISRSFLSSLTWTDSNRFCNFFLLGNGYREILNSDIFLDFASIFTCTKNSVHTLIVIANIQPEYSPISKQQIQEILGILTHRDIYKCVIIGDISTDFKNEFNGYQGIGFDTYSYLDLCSFYWDKNISFKEDLLCWIS